MYDKDLLKECVGEEPFVSVIIPAYKEKEINKNISLIQKEIKKLGIRYEILVVDDGSPDDTYLEALKNTKKNVRIFKCSSNQGKGAVLKKGFSLSRGNLSVFLDADLDIPPSQIETMFEYLIENEADAVIGSKRHPKSQIKYPWYRRFLSYNYYMLTKLLLNPKVKDTQVGLKLFKSEVLKKNLPKTRIKKHAFDLELILLIDKMGYKIVEAPIIIDFKNERSSINAKSIAEIFLDTLKIFYRFKILKN
jgi:dolichol-phosphate mannosyltransferase